MKFIQTTKLKPGMVIGQSILGITDLEDYVCGKVLSQMDINLMKSKGLFGIYVMESANNILSPSLMKYCLKAVKENNINSMFALSKDIVTELQVRPLLLDFKSIRSFDDYLPHHSVCVAVYAVSVGLKLGLVQTQLNALALAGLLHDIGLSFSDKNTLSKTDKLNQEEYDLIKRHTLDGYEHVKQHDQIPSIVKDAILHHHENVNGTGYPDGLNGSDTSLLARILHVVDVYDAIMAKRPYKNGMSNAEAINYLIGGKTILFDEKIVDAFLQIAVPYPTGITVNLSNGTVAEVIGQTKYLNRPLVYFEDTKSIVNLSLDTAYKDINIVSDTNYEVFIKSGTPEPSKTSPAIQRTKKQIMIVDDVYVSITYAKLALGNTYDVVTCMSGKEACLMVKKEQPDLILMDYEMPDMDGVSVVNELHNLGYDIPIIFLTGKNDPDTVYQCIRSGAVDYILKPVNPVYLRTRVEIALKNTHYVDFM